MQKINREINGKRLPDCMIGTWAWGKGVNGSRMIFGKTYSEEQLVETFRTACEAGFCLWDTAEVYGMGNAERILSRCIEGKREVVISTKHMPGKRYKKGEIEKAVDGSRQRLGIDKIDLYWLHEPFALQENMQELSECVRKGKIKEIGLSNCSIAQIKESEEVLRQNGFRLFGVQNHFSLLAMEGQKGIIEYCSQNRIVYFGYMVLEQGALSGNYDAKHPFPAVSLRGLSFSKRKFKKIQPLIEYERELAAKYRVEVSQIPIAWSLHYNIVPIIGLTKPKYVKPLLSGMKLELSAEETERLEQLALDSGVKCKGVWEPDHKA